MRIGPHEVVYAFLYFLYMFDLICGVTAYHTFCMIVHGWVTVNCSRLTQWCRLHMRRLMHQKGGSCVLMT